MQAIAFSVGALLENGLLASLPHEERQSLLPHLELVRFDSGEVLYEHEDTFKHLYFPLDCVISGQTIMEDGATVEIALIGREGLVGVAAVLGQKRARQWTRVLVGGRTLKIKVVALETLFHEREPIRQILLNYYRLLIAQVTRRAVCNARHTLMNRLCCWLLMVHDRVGRDELPLTHEQIAGRLGLRRAGITVAARYLLAEGAINYRRGHIHILDRDLLEQGACRCYEVFRSGFEDGLVQPHMPGSRL
jgi:CRP-like cAMP-binding protein